jgi:hypothetical protein
MAAIIGKITVNANDLCASPSRVLDGLQQKLAILTKAGQRPAFRASDSWFWTITANS